MDKLEELPNNISSVKNATCILNLDPKNYNKLYN